LTADIGWRVKKGYMKREKDGEEKRGGTNQRKEGLEPGRERGNGNPNK